MITPSTTPPAALLGLTLLAGCFVDPGAPGGDTEATTGSSTTGSSTTKGSTGGSTAASSTETGETGETGDLEGVCGDAALDPGEECDLGPFNGPGSLCKADCTVNVCGDGDQSPLEGCDDGNTVDGDGCSASCKGESCGNGLVEAGEECDDGNQVDDDECSNLCALPTCGDQIVQAGEECDDGNQSNSDACTNQCLEAACGDGLVHAGVEACDDGDEVDDNQCTNACELHVDARRVFVTSVEYTGDLGGVDGADAKCQARAEAVGLGGSWMAWISGDDDTSAPAARFAVKAPKGYARTDGVKVADSWADLTDGSLDAPINRVETGAPASGEDQVWTNTAAAGARKGGSHCMSWTVGTPIASGHSGRWPLTDAKWSDASLAGCNRTHRLLCFEN